MLMDSNLVGVIIGSVSGGSVITVLVNNWVNKYRFKVETDKLKAETVNIVTETYNKLVGDLRNEVSRLEDRVKRMSEREGLYVEHNKILLMEKGDLLTRVRKLEVENDEKTKEITILKGKFN